MPSRQVLAHTIRLRNARLDLQTLSISLFQANQADMFWNWSEADDTTSFPSDNDGSRFILTRISPGERGSASK